ncbi:MAG: NAD(P)H-hydrate dehydratase [Chitinophagaceae bacterium]|nr:MAG: NAD(P)H-hydrate dehydratase [Chitinophagaceae bacterium]
MKILSSDQIRKADLETIKNKPISSIGLMERASSLFSDWFMTTFDADEKIAVVCGMGNNGGDGLAFARMIYKMQYKIDVYIIKTSDKGSDDFEINLKRLHDIGKINIIEISTNISDFQEYTVLVDAIFGTGLNRPAEGFVKEVIENVNQAESKVCSIDMPSGLMADSPSTGSIIQADYTFSFERPKLAFFMPENEKYTGQWVYQSIDLDSEFMDNCAVKYHYLIRDIVLPFFTKRKKFSHKGSFGHVLFYGTSYGKAGAGILTSHAALRSGCGLVSAYIPECNYIPFQTAIPEVMVMTGKGKKKLSDLPENIDAFDTLACGPGMDTDNETIESFYSLLKSFKKPVVLDADAVNAISINDKLWNVIPEKSILTPHPGEFKRIAGEWKNGFEKLDKLRAMSAKQNVIIVLKGAYTAIALPDGNVYFNSTGNSGMATAGSGDVLTGIIAAFLAKGLKPEQAALTGVYLHGMSGDTALASKGAESLIAGDIINALPYTFLNIAKLQ